MFAQNPGARASGTALRKNRGRTASANSASVAPMMNRGLAERCVSCFWKTLETGLATFLANTNRAVSMRRLCFGGHLNGSLPTAGNTPSSMSASRTASSADCCPSSEFSRPPLEMPTPLVLPRMEQADQFASGWIPSGNIGALVPVAVKAGQGKVLGDRWTTVLPRNDVIDMKREGISGDRQTTVLATALRSLPDLADQVLVHERGSFGGSCRRDPGFGLDD